MSFSGAASRASLADLRPLEAMEDERAFLLRWALKRHAASPGGGVVDEHGADVRAFDSLDVRYMQAAVVAAAVDRGGTIRVADLRSRSGGSLASSAAAASRTSSPTVSEADRPVLTLVTQSLDGYLAEAEQADRDPLTSYAPALLRRPVMADVRPFAPWCAPLPLLRDRLVPDQARRAALVSVCGYEHALAACGFRARCLTDIALALDLPTVVVKGVTRALTMHESPPPARACDATDVAWRLACLEHSFRNGAESLAAFSGDAQLLRDWRTRCVLVFVDAAVGGGGGGCDAADAAAACEAALAALDAGEAEQVAAAARLRALAVPPLPASSSPASAAEPAAAEGGGGGGASQLVVKLPKEVAAEMYAALVLLSVPVTDDCDADADEHRIALAPLRAAWGFDEALHAAVRATLYAECLTVQGGREIITARALDSTLRGLPPPEKDGDGAQVWASFVASAVGRIYKVFLVPCRSVPEDVLRVAFDACAVAVSVCDRDVFRRHLRAVVRSVGETCPFDAGDLADEVRSWVVTYLASNAAYYSVKGHWAGIVAKAVAEEAEEEGPLVGKLLPDGSVAPLAARGASPPAKRARVLLELACVDARAYDALVAASECRRTAEVVAAAHLHCVADALLDGLGDRNLGLGCPETTRLLAVVRRVAGRATSGGRCGDGVLSAVEKMSARVRPSAEAWVATQQEALSDYVGNVKKNLCWTVDREERLVLPEVHDVFQFMNDIVARVGTFFYAGAEREVRHVAQLVSGNVQWLVALLTDPFPMSEHLARVTDMRASLPLLAMVVALNSVEETRKEYVACLEGMRDAWAALAPLLSAGGGELRLSSEATLDFVEGKKRTLMRHMAGKIVWYNLQEEWREQLYSIDAKHYKKYKHDKKFLLRNGAEAHLRPCTDTTVQTILSKINGAMDNSLPYVSMPELRMPVVGFCCDIVCLLLEWVILSDSTPDDAGGRFFHENHAPQLRKDMQAVEELFYSNGSVCARPAPNTRSSFTHKTGHVKGRNCKQTRPPGFHRASRNEPDN